NAIKFTLDKGEISLELIREKEFIHITVKDDGIGIVEKELERIFDKFYTGGDPMQHSSGKYEFGARGTGLGLAIAKNYAEIHGGRLWAESDGPGKGSSFHLLVPEKLS
ncbi:MAG: ATP-binding protein, partial [Blastocatellia bacterium]|nr:ATP-binding protein [Blastocatellia bacterium]